MLKENIRAKTQSAKDSVLRYVRVIKLVFKVTATLGVLIGLPLVGFKVGYMAASQKSFQGVHPETGVFTLKGASVYLSGNCSVLNTENLINLHFHEAKVTYADNVQIIGVLSNLKEPMTVQCSTKTTTVDTMSYPDLRDAMGKIQDRPGKYSIVSKKKEEQDEILKFKGQPVVASAICRNTQTGESSPSFTGKILDVLSIEKQGEKTMVYVIRRDDQTSLVCDSKSFMARLATEKDLNPKEETPAEQAATNMGNMSEEDSKKNPLAIDYEGKTLLVTATCQVRTRDNELRKMNLINSPVEVSKYRMSADGKFEELQGLSGEIQGQVFCNRKEWPIQAVIKTSKITLKSFENNEDNNKKKK